MEQGLELQKEKHKENKLGENLSPPQLPESSQGRL